MLVRTVWHAVYAQDRMQFPNVTYAERSVQYVHRNVAKHSKMYVRCDAVMRCDAMCDANSVAHCPLHIAVAAEVVVYMEYYVSCKIDYDMGRTR